LTKNYSFSNFSTRLGEQKVKMNKKPKKIPDPTPKIQDLIQKYGMNFHDVQRFMENLAKQARK